MSIRSFLTVLAVFILAAFAPIAHAQAASPSVQATFALSAQPPYTLNQSLNLVATVTNTLPASMAAVAAIPVTLTGTLTFSVAGGASQSVAINQVVATIPAVAAVNNLASNINVSTVVPTTLFTVGTLPTGVTYTAATGALVIAPSGTLDGGASQTFTIPVTFR